MAAKTTTPASLAPLPQGVASNGNQLVLAINDRLRRIAQSLGTGSGAAGPPGATGAPGTGGGSGSSAYYTITPSGGNALIDLSNGTRQRLVLSATAVSIPSVIYTSETQFTLYVDEDAVGGRDAPQFNTSMTLPAGTFAVDVPLVQIDPTANTRTTYQFGLHPGTPDVWGLDSTPRTGGAIT